MYIPFCFYFSIGKQIYQIVILGRDMHSTKMKTITSVIKVTNYFTKIKSDKLFLLLLKIMIISKKSTIFFIDFNFHGNCEVKVENIFF